MSLKSIVLNMPDVVIEFLSPRQKKIWLLLHPPTNRYGNEITERVL